MQYRLNTLDIDSNGEINDAYRTSDVLDLPEDPSIEDVCNGLKSVERMASDWPVEKVKIESEDNGDIYVLNEKGKKVYHLEPERS